MIILDSNNTNIDSNGSAENRNDVTFKKILRFARHYYHDKIELLYKYNKNKRRKDNKFVKDGVRHDSFFLKCIDSLVEDLFQPELLKLLDIDSTDLGNHLASLVSAKDFQNELK